MSAAELVTLADCPPGPFLHDGVLGFKTEYGASRVDEKGANMPGDQVRWVVTQWPDAYCMDSGEMFWAGAKNDEERAALLVQPVDVSLLVHADIEAPCENGEHCCCCAPGLECCDCGEVIPPREPVPGDEE